MSEVSVLVLNYATPADTMRCVEAIAAGDQPGVRIHVIDNASPDGSGPALQSWLASTTGRAGDGDAGRYRSFGPLGGAREVGLTLSARNDGYAAGNNIGLRRALEQGSGWAWVLNADTVPRPDALRRMLAVARRDPRIGVVGCTVLGEDARVQSLGGAGYGRWTGRHRPLGEGLDEAAAARGGEPAVDYVSGCSMLLSLAALRRTGLLLEGLFLYGEEFDLAQRMRAAGLALAVAPDAVVVHRMGASTGTDRDWGRKSPAASYWATRSAVALARLHAPRRAPVVAAARLALSARLLPAQPAVAAAVARAVRDGLRLPLGSLRVPAAPAGPTPSG